MTVASGGVMRWNDSQNSEKHSPYSYWVSQNETTQREPTGGDTQGWVLGGVRSRLAVSTSSAGGPRSQYFHAFTSLEALMVQEFLQSSISSHLLSPGIQWVG